ncbi:hypothetical protein F0L74_22955 [Chitinophaga agrisoli]|uniref:Uncharacterized protein n=1 Tax=Chitinophaga agrisoli TaxID=2607653 RepID=A0A5B2VJL6_9BACT|nr:hypothetical protein [Chitinophaga agrisoli]KAA2239074.1 hypothetical protein F0L74_22955 [Chitinophaga agrisoli]
MTKKALLTLIIACFYHFVLYAENIADFSIPATYLENGKVRLNAAGSTSFKFTVSCLRSVVGGTSDYEPANISVTLVAYHPGSNGAPVMVNLGGPYTIKTADFNNTIATKSFDAVTSYTGIQNETGIALLWSSNQFPTPSLYNKSYQFVPYTPPADPISNNTIAFNTPYVYMNNLDVSGSTPAVQTGSYTYYWHFDMGGDVNNPADYTVIANTVNSLQLAPSNRLINGTYRLTRVITDANGVINTSNELVLTRPSSSIILNVVELPGNTKQGDAFLVGTVAHLGISNPTPGIKYLWYYYHWYIPVNVGYIQLASGEGTSFDFTLSPTRLPFPNARPENIYVWGSDGSTGNFGIQLIN